MAYQISTALFVLLFTMTRIVNLTMLVYTTTYGSHAGESNTLGPFQYVLWPIVAMQFYWWVKIVAQLYHMIMGTSPSKGEKDGKGPTRDVSPPC